jgi:hypothetical protein
MSNKIEIGQLRCDSHMEDVIYEIVEEDPVHHQYRVIYHVLDDIDNGTDDMVINDLNGLKVSYKLNMWFDAYSLSKDPIWSESNKKDMPSF